MRFCLLVPIPHMRTKRGALEKAHGAARLFLDRVLLLETMYELPCLESRPLKLENGNEKIEMVALQLKKSTRLQSH